jgi:hypothetical protein
MQITFKSLISNLWDVMKTATQDDNKSSEDLRSILIFINEVARVVDQAFTGVLGILVKYKSLTEQDLALHKLPALALELESLRTRHHFKEAGDICGQLKILKIQYENEIAEKLDPHVKYKRNWESLFGLLEEREGKVVELVEQSIARLQCALYKYTGFKGFEIDYYNPNNLEDGKTIESIRGMVRQTSQEIENMLSEISSIKNSILGLSGRPGLLELVNVDRFRLKETITYMTNNDYSKNININNSPGAIANMADYMENVTNHVNQNLNSSTAPNEVKELVKQLAEQIAVISARIDQPKAELMGKDVKTLSEEMANPQPRKSWYKVALESIKETATTIGEIAKPVLDIIGKLSPLLLIGS